MTGTKNMAVAADKLRLSMRNMNSEMQGGDPLTVKYEESDVWNDLAEFLGDMIAKYADALNIDTLPDPRREKRLEKIRAAYTRFMEIRMGKYR